MTAPRRSAQEEQLDWLHSIHSEMVAQTDELKVHTELLDKVRGYTRFFYVLGVIYVILTALAIVGWLLALTNSQF